MNFEETLKKIFVDDFFTKISLPEILINLAFVTLIGIFIYIVYRTKNKNSFYSKEFNIILIVLPIITAAIVISMKNSMALSLGMIGALSIVRFRNAVKSSMDLLYIFWAITIGIICGGGLYALAIILSILLALILIIFDVFPEKKENNLLVINSNNIQIEQEVIELLKKYKFSYKRKSKSIHNNCIDLILEIRGKRLEEFVLECSKLKELQNINVLSHEGDIRL